MSTLYVGGLPANAGVEKLRGLFERFASVVSIRLVRRQPGGAHRGFGYVTFADAREARQAIADLNGTDGLRVAKA